MFAKARKGQNLLGYYVLTIFAVIVASQVLGAIPLLIALAQSGAMTSGSTDMLALIWMVKKVHKRSFSDTTTGAPAFRWERFFKGFGIWALLSVILVGLGAVLMPDALEWNFQPGPFLILLVIVLLLIPFQTGFEEVLFRGYLLQAFELLTKNKWASVLITSLGFALLHIFNPEVEEFGMGLAMAQYITFGLLFGVITVLDNGLELAWGMHAANNIFLALFVTHDASALQTPAMFKAVEINPVMDFISLVIAGAIFFGICWKLFDWSMEAFNPEPVIPIAAEGDSDVLDS